MSAQPTPVTAVTAKNQFVQGANGVRYAYRRLGAASPSVPPLVLLQHFRGNLDNWDPALVDALSARREVILFDNVGVGLSNGTVPSTVAQMARDAIAFLEALNVKQADLLGFSLGGFVAQEIALIRPALVRRLVLAGTGPKGAPGMHGWRQDIADHARRPEPRGEDLLYIFFAHTQTSQAKGVEFLGRFMQRSVERDQPSSLAARDAQYDAVLDWGIPDHGQLQRLTAIRQPTLVIQGDDDLMIPTRLSHLMAGLIPNARIKIYPDSAHAFLFQYPVEVAGDVDTFLSA
ncbi:alpha/beta fold hydrolase [Cystobacter ferrugineus]|uniref:Alpha/beta hydrolase n=1 Tax=Cystobacter ferrugineus TaxID=83449 RepID=A0A1L9B4M0_9BACT|nr:alpha/beta hydrolase [Cystobacter ferrugineus]OJH37204.1 alpha/beta hydrolase [Cystobacter ferrugineus]